MGMTKRDNLRDTEREELIGLHDCQSEVLEESERSQTTARLGDWVSDGMVMPLLNREKPEESLHFMERQLTWGVQMSYP